MRLIKTIYICLMVVCVGILALRIGLEIKKTRELRQFAVRKDVSVTQKKEYREKGLAYIRKNRRGYIIPVLGVFSLAFMLWYSDNYWSVEIFFANMDKQRIALELDKEIEEIVDPIDYQDVEESNNQYMPEETVIFESYFYEECKEILGESDALLRVEGYEQKAKEVLDRYLGGVYGENNLPNYEKLLLEFLGKERSEIRSVYEVSDKIAEYEDPRDVPVELYLEELLARKYVYQKNPTRENAWLAARAADDVVTLLGKDTDLHTLLVCGAESMKYYLEMLKYEELEKSNKPEQPMNYDVYLDISVLLEKILNRSEMLDYKQHFRMLSNAFLAQIDGRIRPEKDTLCKAEFYFYYGVGRYEIGWTYGIKDESYYADTLVCLQKYLEQETQRTPYTKSCVDSAINILVEYPQLNTSFWEKRLRDDISAREMGLIVVKEVGA